MPAIDEKSVDVSIASPGGIVNMNTPKLIAVLQVPVSRPAAFHPDVRASPALRRSVERQVGHGADVVSMPR